MANTKNTKTQSKTTKKTEPKIKKVEISKIEVSEKKEIQTKNEQNPFLIVLGIIILAVIAIVVFGLTYSYFSANVKEIKPNDPDAVIKTADLLVRYQDGDSNIELGTKIEPGDILTKDFSVKNEGNDTGIYTIVIDSLKHNLGHKETLDEQEVLLSDVTYKLLKIDTLNGEETQTIISTGTLPFELDNKTPFIIYTKDEVFYEKTNNYRLEVTYVNHLQIDQSDSMGEKLELRINIINYEGEQRTNS